jgi:DnaA family protein
MKQLALSLAPPPAPSLDNFSPGRNGELLSVLGHLIAGRDVERSIYIWGEPGSGRSHLLRAAISALRAAGLNCAYLTPADAMPESAGLRAVAVDDVESLSAGSQRVFFHLYNQLRERAGIVLAAGNVPPAKLRLRPELLTRLGWGLVYQVQALTDDEKAEALKLHATARAFDLPDGVIDYLLRHLSRDLPSLLGVLDALDLHSLETKRPITLPLLKELLETPDDSAR